MIAAETQVGWQDYLAIVIRRRMHFLVPCILIIIASVLVGMSLPKVYRAETIVLIQEKQVMNPLISGLAISTSVGQRMRILKEEMLGWTSLSRLAHELGMDKTAHSPMAFEQLIRRLQRGINVGMHGRDLVVISFEDEDPKLAQSLVNTITNIYMDRNIESQAAETDTAITFIESEMAVYQKKLEDSERALREFKELYVMQMPVATQLNEQIIEMEVALAQLLVENTEAHPTIIQLRRRIQDMKTTRNEEIKRVIMTAMAKGADPSIYQDLANALDKPVALGDAENPTLKAAKEAYQSWVSRLDSPINVPQTSDAPQIQVIAPVDPNDPEAANSLQVLGAGSASLSLAPREQQEMARLTRDYEVHAGTYQHMKQRLERAKVTQRLGESDEGTKFKILEPARLPLRPVRPNLAKIFVFSLMLGMFVGAGVAFIAEYLDQSFQSAEDVQAMLELPVIGSISTIVTESDLENRRRRRKGWMTFQHQLHGVKTYVVNPLWSLVDRALVRWGL